VVYRMKRLPTDGVRPSRSRKGDFEIACRLPGGNDAIRNKYCSQYAEVKYFSLRPHADGV